MSVKLYGDTPFALLIDGLPTDLQSYRPDPRNYLKAGSEYPATVERYQEGGIRSVSVIVDGSQVRFAKIR